MSPPHSPSGTPRSSVDQGVYSESVFVTECLTDNFESIGRAEMNKYLQPDQSAVQSYPSALGGPLPPPTMPALITTLASTSTTSTTSGITAVGPNSPSGLSCPPTLTSLTNIPSPSSRLIAGPPAYGGGNSSPYYVHTGSPGTTTGSPEGGCIGSTSPSASPDSAGDFVELQPPRINKDEPLPSLGSHKSMNPFIHQSIYQNSYGYGYPYTYASMWHG